MEKQPLTLSPTVRVVLLIACYAALLFWVVSFHEIGSDEMHDLSMAISSESLPGLIQKTFLQGVPALWHIVLWAGFHLTNSVLILKSAGILFVTAAIYLFIRFSPFSGFEKFIFPLGFFPLYEYSILSRSYGLSMLLLFLACTFYPRRFKNLVPLALAAFLLANTNAHCLIITVALFACLLMQSFTNRAEIQSPKLWVAGHAIIAAGIVLALLQVIPDPLYTANYYRITPGFALRAAPFAIAYPGAIFSEGFSFREDFLSLSILLFYLATFRKRSTGLFFFVGGIGLSLFLLLIHLNDIRHQGFLYLLMIAALWMERLDETPWMKTASGGSRIIKAAVRYRNAFFLMVLVMQMIMGFSAVYREILWPYSSSLDFGAFLKRDARLRDAVLVPEPGYLAESIAFYVDNPIYQPRENKFSNYVERAPINAAELSLDALLDTAARVQKERAKPVLLVLGHKNLNSRGPYTLTFLGSRKFQYSRESWERLKAETVVLTKFSDSLSGEDYTIYLLKEQNAL